MSFFNQVGAVTAMNLSSLPQRVGASLVTIVGVAACIVAAITSGSII